jgi:hypothetical protein
LEATFKSKLSPKTWQDFEILTKNIGGYKLGGEFENYGKCLGHSPIGIDIDCWDSNNRNIAIQCKHKSNGLTKMANYQYPRPNS